MKSFKLLLAGSALMAAGAFADGYSQAGCGLGSMVLGDKPGFTQVFAATTNCTSGSQTFGISSGTSNCGSGAFSANDRLPQYIEANKVALSSDVARGAGETISGVASILGCSSEAALGQALKSNYQSIFSGSETAEQASKNMMNVIRTNKALSCKRVG